MQTTAVSPPRDNSYAEALRFIVQSAEADDPTLKILVPAWSLTLSKGGLRDGMMKSAVDAIIEQRLREHGVSGYEQED